MQYNEEGEIKRQEVATGEVDLSSRNLMDIATRVVNMVTALGIATGEQRAPDLLHMHH